MVENEEIKTNPLLKNWRLPGETFRLPSLGLFYGPDVLDPSVKNGEVEVFPLTTIDEVVLSTPDKLLSGKAIEEVFQRCVPQITNVKQLLSQDVDFLLACLRMVSFGREMDIEYKHTCENANKHTYGVSVQQLINKAKQIDPTTIESEYVTKLPNGQVVRLQPLKYGDVIRLYELTTLQKTEEISDTEATQLVTNALVGLIDNVDGETNRQLIEEWVVALPLGWKRQIEQKASAWNRWGVDFSTTKKCKDCQAEIVLEVTANPVSFFI